MFNCITCTSTDKKPKDIEDYNINNPPDDRTSKVSNANSTDPPVININQLNSNLKTIGNSKKLPVIADIGHVNTSNTTPTDIKLKEDEVVNTNSTEVLKEKRSAAMNQRLSQFTFFDPCNYSSTCESDLMELGAREIPEDLAGSSREYDIQILVISDTSSDSWASQVGVTDKEPVTTLEKILKAIGSKKHLSVNTIVPYIIDVTDAGCVNRFDKDDIKNGTLLIYPPGVLIPASENIDIPDLIHHLITTKIDKENYTTYFDKYKTKKDIMKKKIVITCCHTKRDARCGYFGFKALMKIAGIITENDKFKDISSFATSHVGGHGYAPNIICFPDVDYYGLVDTIIEKCLESHFVNGHVYKPHWRGRMGVSQDNALENAENEDITPTRFNPDYDKLIKLCDL